MIKRIFFGTLVALASLTLFAQPSPEIYNIDEMLKFAESGNEAKIIEFKSRIESQPKQEYGNRKEARKRNGNGLRALNSGNLIEALEEFQAALNLDPADPEIINNVGFALGKMKRYREAAGYIRSSLVISPGRTGAWYNLGEVLSELDDQNAAASAWRIAYLFSTNKEKTLEFLTKAAEKQSLSEKTRITIISVIDSPQIEGRISNYIEVHEAEDSSSAKSSKPKDPTFQIENNRQSISDLDTPIISTVEATESSIKTENSNHQDRSNESLKGVAAAGDLTKESSSAMPSENMNGATSSVAKARIFKLLLIGAVCSLIALLVAGATNRIVIFYDWKDVGLTLMIFGSMIITSFLIWMFDGDKIMEKIILGLGSIAMLYFSARTIVSSVKHNKSIALGVIVGVFKIFVSMILGLLAAGKLSDALKKTNSLGVRIFATVALGILFYVASILVNGERVNDRRASI